jgi:indole-3-glycerol phosphate synthase
MGINNRNLNTFETTLDTTRILSKQVPEDRMIVCESGLRTPADLSDMAMHGARAFLIGESLMRQDDVETATRTLLANPTVSGGGL